MDQVFFWVEIGQFGDTHVCPKSVKKLMKGVAVAPHGLVFGQNEARRLQEGF